MVKTNQSPSAGTVATNGVLTYNLRVSNLGTDPVSNVVVQDTLPAGSRYISAKDTATGSAAFFCSHDGSSTGGVVTCVGGDLDGSINTIPVGGFRDIRVRVFAPNAPGTITNQAAVDPGNAVPEGNEFDNDAQVDTTVAACVDLASCTDTNAFYELTIDKTQESPANPVARNGIVTYQLKVSNLGSDPVFGVTASDRLPEGFRFIDAQDIAGPPDPNAFTCGGPDASRVLTCTGGSLSGTVAAIPGGAPTERTIEIRVFAPDTPGSYPNLAFVDPGNVVPEGNEFNNQDTVHTVVANGGNGPYIDLSVDKEQWIPAGNASVAPGGQLAYKIEVKNGGAGDAFNVTVADVLPAHTTFFNAADAAGGAGAFTCAYASGVVTCSGGTIPAGGSRTVQVLLLAPASIEEYASNLADISIGLTNQAFVDPLNAIPEGDETNNADYVDTTVKSKINLTVTKEGPDTAHQNDTADYVIKVKNNKVGPDGQTAYGVRMVDPLPIGLIPLSVKAEPSNFSCQLLENPVNVVDCIGDLAPDQEVTITVNVFVTADGGPLDNEACVDPDHVIAETDETDNCVNKTTSVTVLAPNLLMNKSADATSVTAGQQFTYTLTVSNIGDGPTTSAVTVTDPLPNQVTLVNTNADAAFDCTASTATNVSCELASLDPGAAASIQVLVTLNDGVTDLSFPNTATASGGGDPTPSSDTFTTFVGGSGTDLVLTDVSDQPDPVAAGALLTYTINVLNTGTEDSGAFEVTQVFDSLAGLTLVSAVGSEGFTCSLDIPTKTVTCGGTLLAGKDTTLTIRFTTDASAVPSVQSTVTVDSGEVVAESNEANNTDIETTTSPRSCARPASTS